MNTLANLITATIIAAWIGGIAILSIQNVTLVSLKFLTFNSVQLPVGVLLAFSAGIGSIIGGIAPLFWQTKKSKPSSLSGQEIDDLDDLDFDIT